MSSSRRVQVAVTLALLVFPSACAAGQEDEAAMEAGPWVASTVEIAAAAEAAELLNIAPVGEVGDRETLTASQFLEAANEALAVTGRRPVESLDDAVEGLEQLAGLLGPVSAIVETKPPGSEVFYRRAYQRREGSHPVVTTNDTVTLRIAGEYFFWVVDTDGSAVEQRKDCRYPCRVSFDLRGLGAAAVPTETGGQRIRFGETRRGVLSPVDADPAGRRVQSWRLTTDVDRHAFVELESSDFDTLLTIIDPDGFVLRDDDSGCGYNSRVSIDLEAKTEYRIWVTSFSGTGEGDFVLRVVANPPPESC